MAAKLRIRSVRSRAGTIFVQDHPAMNTSPTAFVRLALVLLLAAASGSVSAQRDSKSLTEDFGKLSAKERARIAEQETREAAADSAFQRVMHSAETTFQQGRYQEALETFQEARKMRPFNVYPKVKIQDLQALIKKKQEEAAKQAQAAPPQPPPTQVATAPTPHIEQAETVPVPPPDSPPEATPAAPVEATPPAPEAAPTLSVPVAAEPIHVAPAPQAKPDVPPPQAAPPPEPNRQPAATPVEAKEIQAPGERIYKEAGAVVTERTVPDDGQLVTYKRVVHPWGQTFYFKDGRSISAREWDERFKE